MACLIYIGSNNDDKNNQVTSLVLTSFVFKGHCEIKQVKPSKQTSREWCEIFFFPSRDEKGGS